VSIDRLTHRLDNWKRQLIDLSRRNRLLNYRATKASTVEITDEVPQLILRHLLRGGTFEFDPKPEPATPELVLGDARAQRGLGPAHVPRTLRNLDEEDIEEQHTDDRLQTTLLEARLNANLLAIYRRAEESIEEQGVNTLFLALGMLEWHESDDSDVISKAPLIMLPVELRRRTAASQFVLAVGDDDPIMNPAIVEKLRLDFRIQLPDLPEMTDDLDVDRVFSDVRNAVEGFPRWRLTTDVALGLFSFQKFIMYRDLERNAEKLREHRIIRAVCQEGESSSTSSLPPDIANADLDETMSPWAAVQVVDADSSQQQALLAVKKGNDLVIEGPPGTGKSQTITNLIADALNDGKTVLFVAEKMAALEVVKSRLEHDAGLGDYVLELHSNKASKREFVENLTRALDRFEIVSGSHDAELGRLRDLSGELRQYVVQLHQPYAPLGKSPFQAIAEIAEIEDSVGRVNATVAGVEETNTEAFVLACRRLDDLARMLKDVGAPDTHPLRGVGLETVGRSERDLMERATAAAGRSLTELTEAAHEVALMFGLRTPETLGDAQMMVGGARTIARSPGADVSVLENSAWNQISSDAEDILRTGTRYAQMRQLVTTRFRDEILEQDTTLDVQLYASCLDRGAWRVFIPSYWGVRGRLRALIREGYRPDGARGLLADLKTAESCRADLVRIRDADGAGKGLFAGRWKGPESDWRDLRSFAEWVVQFRSYALKEALGADAIQIAARAQVNADAAASAIDALQSSVNRALESLADLTKAGALEAESGISFAPETRIGDVGVRVAEMEGSLDHLRAYAAYVAARCACMETIAREYVPAAITAQLRPAQITPGFRRLFFELWLERVFVERPALGRFHAAQHEERIDAFRSLDRKSLSMARDRTQSALHRRRMELVSGGLTNQLQLLQREARKRSRIMPVRKLLARTADAIQRIKPCFMMSPLSVAQYLDPDAMSFDLIVFDEASQIPPADAIGAIIRAERVVVVGDSKQLPPTNFFGAHLEDEEMDESDEIEMLEDLESILDEVAVAGVPSVRLKWHYRSQHQSLIRFSNEEFYADDPLYVFPAAVRDDDHLGLKFEFVEDGVYEGAGQNTIEASRVARAVVEHIQTYPELSLGVGTFGIRQQQVILDEIDQVRRAMPSLEWFFNQEGEKKFFVKNLENIQGDDRDVIFLSVTYGPDVNGLVRRNFGPINKQGGWRRLNVLTTRAKQLMRIFSSMRADQIDITNIAEGAVYLHQFLKYAETGIYPAAKISHGGADSPFETAVMRALERRGYRVVSQVGDAGYRVDLGIVDENMPGRYLCGIECDGATYHRAATVRDRDRLRHQVLELRGWDIHRVWSTDWFHDPRGQIDRLASLIEDSRRKYSEGERRQRERVETPVYHPPILLVEDEAEDNRPAIEDIDVPVYQFARIVLRGAPDAFYTASPTVLARVVQDVLEVEGPIHLSELARRIAACWGMQRVGSQIQHSVEKAVGRLVRSGVLVREDDFVWIPSAPIAVRSRSVDGVTFQAEMIAPCEVVEAVRLLLRHRAPLLPDDLIVETARLLGFTRTGSKLRELIENAKERLVASGELRPGSRGLHLSETA
jgi:very-short-patch-repair endonuclease